MHVTSAARPVSGARAHQRRRRGTTQRPPDGGATAVTAAVVFPAQRRAAPKKMTHARAVGRGNGARGVRAHSRGGAVGRQQQTRANKKGGPSQAFRGGIPRLVTRPPAPRVAAHAVGRRRPFPPPPWRPPQPRRRSNRPASSGPRHSRCACVRHGSPAGRVDGPTYTAGGGGGEGAGGGGSVAAGRRGGRRHRRPAACTHRAPRRLVRLSVGGGGAQRQDERPGVVVEAGRRRVGPGASTGMRRVAKARLPAGIYQEPCRVPNIPPEGACYQVCNVFTLIREVMAKEVRLFVTELHAWTGRPLAASDHRTNRPRPPTNHTDADHVAHLYAGVPRSLVSFGRFPEQSAVDN